MADSTKTDNQRSNSSNARRGKRSDNFGETRTGEDSFASHTVDELRKMAREQDITGGSRMRKDDLIKALEKRGK